MHIDTPCSIGQPSRRTGLTVKTIRSCSDNRIVRPADRSPATGGRALRDLGLDPATVCEVPDQVASVPEVLEAHAVALDVPIRTLRLRRAALRAVARRGPTTRETDLMHHLATLSPAGLVP